MARIIQTADLTEPTIRALSSMDKEWIYNGLDCAVTLEIADKLVDQLDNTSRNTYEFSKSLQAPILEMTLRGVLVDGQQRDRVLTQTKRDISRVADQLHSILSDGVGVTINWRSPTQLIDLFYNVLGLPQIRKRNAQGRMVPTVNREAIERLSAYFYAEPICNHLLLLRDLDKKRSFLETGIDPDGRMRCNFNIAGTNTGRLASAMSDFGSGTNLQNVDRDLRSIFIADPGYKFANLDLEQGDSRNVGAVCWNLFVSTMGDTYAGSYLDACESGDLHTQVCKMAWRGMDWTADPKYNRRLADQIAYRNHTYRDLAKRLGHGTNFYGQPPTMAQHSKLPVAMIQDFQRNYFGAFQVLGRYPHDSDAPTWHNWVRKQLKQYQYITTTGFNRRRFFFGSLVGSQGDKTLREAIAYEPQSMTADEIDTGLIKVWRAGRVQLLLQVHDSILFQYREEEEDEIIPWALETLKTPIILNKGREFCVPTEAKVGWNWGDVIYDSKGNVCGNEEGLIKWKGGDSRKRSERRRLSLQDHL